MAQAAEDIPEADGKRLKRKGRQPDMIDAFLQLGIHHAGFGQTRQVPFDIGQKDRHSDFTEMFSQDFECHRFSGARGPCDQAMPIAHTGQQLHLAGSFSYDKTMLFSHKALLVDSSILLQKKDSFNPLYRLIPPLIIKESPEAE